jgi:mRNA-degrading endonuclease toxin of MazEF toxin-antitoxin module
MPQACAVNCDVLLTVPKLRLIRRITQLSQARMLEIEAALKYALELS